MIVGKLFDWVLAGCNLVVASFMAVSAYSYMLSPEEFPYLSALGLVYMPFFILNAFCLLIWLLRKSVWGLIPFFAIVSTWGAFRHSCPLSLSSQERGKGDVTVLSYNVMTFGELKEHLKEDDPLMAYLADADILCMQEFPADAELRKKFNSLCRYPYNEVVRFRGAGGQTDVACYSRFPILGAEKVETATRVNNGAAVFFLDMDGDSLVVFNCHLESNGMTGEDKDLYKKILNNPEADGNGGNAKNLIRKFSSAAAVRLGQAKDIRGMMDKFAGCRMIVCGDFNDGPLSAAHHVLDRGMLDAYSEKGRGLGVSYNRDYFYFRIDNILVDEKWSVKSCRVGSDIEASDHYPIKAVISSR